MRQTLSATLREAISDLSCVMDVSKTLKKFDKLQRREKPGKKSKRNKK